LIADRSTSGTLRPYETAPQAGLRPVGPWPLAALRVMMRRMTSDDERVRQAQDRQAAAGRRAAELRERLSDLESGGGATDETARRAADANDAAHRHAQEAHERATAARRDAAGAHRSSARQADEVGRPGPAEAD